MVDETKKLLRSMRPRRFEKKTPIADDMFLPNHSGISNNDEAINAFAASNHTHVEADITDLSHFTEFVNEITWGTGFSSEWAWTFNGALTDMTFTINSNDSRFQVSHGFQIDGALTGGGSGHDQFSDFVAAEHVDWAGASAGTIHITNFAALQNVVEDTTPELGGELDAGAHTIGFTQATATGDGTTTIDWKLGNKFFFTFGAQNDTFTFTAPTNPCNLMMVIKQDGTGSRTATWPAAVKWPGGTAPTLTTASNSIDIASFYYDGTNYYGVHSLDFS